MDFWGFNALAFLIGVVILAFLWIASRVRPAHEERPDKALLTAQLMDADTTRRWMRYSETETKDQ